MSFDRLLLWARHFEWHAIMSREIFPREQQTLKKLSALVKLDAQKW